MTAPRDSWSSSLGFIAAASGSAVGLGNLWKFPYITWENHGGAFVLVYLAACLFLGLPIMMAEIFIGRTAQLSGAPAFKKLGNKYWSKLGYLGAASAAVILSYYMVIAGWSIHSFLQCLQWSWHGYHQPAPDAFSAFLKNGWMQVGLTALFTAINGIIVWRGIGKGIEKATKLMMPILVLILLYLVVSTMFMEGRNEALARIFSVHFSAMPAEGYLEAAGQAFFSLSIGLGAMVAYGSYLKKEESILATSAAVVVVDTFFALLACLAMFTIILSIPSLESSMDSHASTVGMLFVTLPEMFYKHLPGGAVVAPLFFVLVGFAALSSTLSLGEVTAAILIDRKHWSRGKAVAVSTATVFGGSILAALSLGANKTLSTVSFSGVPVLEKVFPNKQGVLALLDHLAANWMLPLGGLGITLFMGWYVDKHLIEQETNLNKRGFFFRWWMFSLRYVAPVAIGLLVVAVAMGKDFS